MNAIELSDISVFFGDYEVLRGASAAFPAGKTTLIMGKSGSGKSTLLKTAAGLVVPNRGRVRYGERDLARMTHAENLEFRRRCSFVFQDAALWANQSIYNNLSLPLAVHEEGLPKAESDRRVKDAVRRVGYTESLAYRPADLSMGEQKLVSIARALILEPELMFMDEPTTSLDEESVERVVSEFEARKAAGVTIIAVSHSPRVIARLADYICVVADGVVANFGPAEQVAQQVGGELLKRIRAAREQAGPSIDGPAAGA